MHKESDGCEHTELQPERVWAELWQCLLYPFLPFYFHPKNIIKFSTFWIHWYLIPYFMLRNISSYRSTPSLNYFIFLNHLEVPWIISLEAVFHVHIVIPFHLIFQTQETFIYFIYIYICIYIWSYLIAFIHIWIHGILYKETYSFLPYLFQIIQGRKCYCHFTCFDHNIWSHLWGMWSIWSRIHCHRSCVLDIMSLMEIHIKSSKWFVSVEPCAEIRNSPRNRAFNSWVLIRFQ